MSFNHYVTTQTKQWTNQIKFDGMFFCLLVIVPINSIDGGPSNRETSVPRSVVAGGLARTGSRAAPIGFDRGGAPMLVRHSGMPPAPRRGKGGPHGAGRGGAQRESKPARSERRRNLVVEMGEG